MIFHASGVGRSTQGIRSWGGSHRCSGGMERSGGWPGAQSGRDLKDPTAHAEMQAITAATASIGGKYLAECRLYVTVEPCTMCAGACYWAQVGKVIYGAADPKRGVSRLGQSVFHPKTTVVSGVLEQECGDLVRSFFQKLRK